jgi:hypothetical protein
LLERPVEVPEARQRVGAQHERVGVLRLDGERLVGARLRVLGPAGQEQQRARLQLRVRILRQQVRRAHVFAERSGEVLLLHVGVGELQVRLRQHRVFLHRVPQLQDGGVNFALLEIRGAAIQAALGAPRATGHRHRHRHHNHGRTEGQPNPALDVHGESLLQPRRVPYGWGGLTGRGAAGRGAMHVRFLDSV